MPVVNGVEITEIGGRLIALNPTPDNIADRIAWALHNSGAIGANRATRGVMALHQLSTELGMPTSALRAHMDSLNSKKGS